MFRLIAVSCFFLLLPYAFSFPAYPPNCCGGHQQQIIQPPCHDCCCGHQQQIIQPPCHDGGWQCHHQPPIVQPPNIHPPIIQPPIVQPPIMQPPIIQPPIVQPPRLCNPICQGYGQCCPSGPIIGYPGYPTPYGGGGGYAYGQNQPYQQRPPAGK